LHLIINLGRDCLQSYEEERFGDARSGTGGSARTRCVLLRDERLHLLRRERGVREFDTRRLDRASSAAFLDDESEKSAKTFVTGNKRCVQTILR